MNSALSPFRTLLRKNATQKWRSCRASFIEYFLPLLLLFLIGVLKSKIYDSFRFDAADSKTMIGHLDANYAMFQTMFQTSPLSKFDYAFCFVGSDDGWEAFQSFTTSPTNPMYATPVRLADIKRFSSRDEMTSLKATRSDLEPFLVGVVETITTTPIKKKSTISTHDTAANNLTRASGADSDVLMTYNYDLYQYMS